MTDFQIIMFFFDLLVDGIPRFGLHVFASSTPFGRACLRRETHQLCSQWQSVS